MNTGSSLACSQKPALVPNLSQTNPVHALPSYLGSIWTLSSNPSVCLPMIYFCRIGHQTPGCISLFSNVCHMLRPFHTPWFDRPNNKSSGFRDLHLQRSPWATTQTMEQQAPPKHSYLYTNKNGATSQKNRISISTKIWGSQLPRKRSAACISVCLT
jgi:hypothetical protein